MPNENSRDATGKFGLRKYNFRFSSNFELSCYSLFIFNTFFSFSANISIKRDASPKAHAKKPYEAIKNQDEDDEPLIYEEDRKVGNKINENSPKPKDFKESKINDMKLN